jgi:4-hydroxybenzoate polyprenyltransferase
MVSSAKSSRRTQAVVFAAVAILLPIGGYLAFDGNWWVLLFYLFASAMNLCMVIQLLRQDRREADLYRKSSD